MVCYRAFLYKVIALVVISFVIALHDHVAFAALTDSAPAPDTLSGQTNTLKEDNKGKSANLSCEPYTYTLACGKTDPITLKKGGINCPCETQKLAGGNVVKGHCVFKKDPENPELPAKGVCEADIQSASNQAGSSGTTNDVTGASSNSNLTGSAGGDSLEPISHAPPLTSSPVSNSPSSVGSGVSNAFNYTSGASQPTSPISRSGYSSGFGSGYNPGYFSGYSSSLNDVPGGNGVYTLPPSATNFLAPSTPSGGNWPYVAQYPYQLPIQNVTAPPPGAVYYYYPGYQTVAQQGNSAVPNATFSQPSRLPTGPIKDYNAFLDILAYTGRAAVEQVRKIYDSFASASQPLPPVTQGVDSSQRAPGANTSVDLIPDSNTDSGSASSVPEERRSEEQFHMTVQQVQNSLRELGTTLIQRQEAAVQRPGAQASTTHSQEGIPRASASSTGAEAHQPPKNSVSEHAATALKTAEDRLTQLQNELEQGRSQLKNSDAKIRELTDELNALNQRIQAVNESLANPNVSDSDRENLIQALITNIQLTLEGVEKRLEEESAHGQPRTVGEVVLQSLQGGISGLIQLIILINQTVADLLHALWRSLFAIGA